uniref:Si:dkeyp-81f3.4 n=1 Tax=Gouania willdenowi TaxID=441366 RepID=A0A8C5N785_GOUWI
FGNYSNCLNDKANASDNIRFQAINQTLKKMYQQTVSDATEPDHLVKSLMERHRLGMEGDTTTDHSIDWASCKDFTVDVGINQIRSYIKTLDLQPHWSYSIDFLYSTEEEEHRTFYLYRARFSTPTARRPIPGTASVYFAVDVSTVKPQTLPVEVHFVVESNRLVHTPGRTRFTEKWLTDVIENKTRLRNVVDL